MKVAFTSCMSTRALGVQPVWGQIASKHPDALVLLGDSVYMDVPGPAPESDNEYAEQMLALYRRQLQVPGFASLLAQLRAPAALGTHAIWDDHDFLWNDADAAQALRPDAIGRALYSANLFRLWCQALRTGQAMPDINTHEVQDGYCRPAFEADYRKLQPGYRWQLLQQPGSPTVLLHLTDGRSWRRGQTLLGDAQWAQIEQTLRAWPDAIHLLASGSACRLGGQRSAWSSYPGDLLRLRRNAARYRLLVLSGDIHRNDSPAPLPSEPAWGPRPLWEATSSGAAVNFNPLGQPEPGSDILGSHTERFGLLDISQSGVEVRFYAHGAPDTKDTANGGYRIPASFVGGALPL